MYNNNRHFMCQKLSCVKKTNSQPELCSITNYDNITALWIQQTVIILVSTKMDTLIILRENLFFVTKKIMQDYLS